MTKKKKNNKRVTVPVFARLVDADEKSIHKALHKGKLSFKLEGRLKMIDPKVGKKEWKMHRAQADVARNKGRPAPNKFFDAEVKEKTFKADLMELKYKEASGELVDVKTVKKKAYELAKRTRDAILSVPSRLAANLASETDPHKVERYLEKELNKALQELSK